MGVTGVLIIHNDSALLGHVLASVRPLIDRLVVVDGAYDWVAPVCRLAGEDPERSTDGLLEVLAASGIPYTRICGTWRDETHKRRASLEACDNARVMRIDADEIYAVDPARLEAFWHSPHALGALQVPLLVHPDAILTGGGDAPVPRAPIFMNLARAGIDDILAGMWLVRPRHEATGRAGAARVHPQALGMCYHLTAFRPAGAAYRRARFYCLVSMRIAGKVGLGLNRPFAGDGEMLEILSELDPGAVDLAFRLHRIAACFPEVGPRQALRVFELPGEAMLAQIRAIHADMLASQAEKTRAHLDRELVLFAGRPCFLDVTREVAAGRGLRLESLDGGASTMRLHLDHGLARETVEAGDRGMIAATEGMARARRAVLELSVHPPQAATGRTRLAVR